MDRRRRLARSSELTKRSLYGPLWLPLALACGSTPPKDPIGRIGDRVGDQINPRSSQILPTFPPHDVSVFQGRRQDCDTWRTMASYDDPAAEPERIAHHCAGLDAELEALREKYAGQKRIIDLLSGYELVGEDAALLQPNPTTPPEEGGGTP